MPTHSERDFTTRAHGESAATRALLRRAFAIILVSLLVGCASADDEGTPAGGALTGTGASGGAAGSGTVEAGGSGAGGIIGAGSAVGAGGIVGGGGIVSAGGIIGGGGIVGAGGFPVVGNGGVGTNDTGGVSAGSTGGVATQGSGGTVAAGGAVNAVCNTIAAGTSTVTVNGVPRTFSVQMPANTSQMALLFLWHGFMQVPTEFANTIVYDVPAGKWVPFDPNAFPMPLMIVTPVDTKLIPPAGLDWDIVNGAKDFPFFEGMLQCIQQQFNVDKNRIYSFGFSAGAVFTNLLSAKYPHLFAATISESGTWFNDQAEWSDVSIPIMTWQWPAFDPADQGNVLLTHGGANDFATVISLESANQKALPYLHNNRRTVTECAHTFGHTLDPDLTQSMYYEWMWAHQLGGPPLSGPIPSFPTQARPVGATSCTFRPAL